MSYIDNMETLAEGLCYTVFSFIETRAERRRLKSKCCDTSDAFDIESFKGSFVLESCRTMWSNQLAGCLTR